MQKNTTRLQLTVLTRHLAIITELKEDYETNSQFVMRILDTMKQEKTMKTNITELAEYFPASATTQSPTSVGGIKSLHFKDYHAQWIPSARVWEVFIDAECEGYIGVVDTLKDAKALAIWHDEQE